MTMDEIREKSTVIHDHTATGRPVVEQRYDRVVEEPGGMSGGAIAAIVISAILATALLTWFIVSNQQQNRDQEMAIERERTLAAERSAAQTQSQQQPQQQPNVVVVPQQQPQTVPVPVPVPMPSQTTPDPTATAPSNTSIEISVNQKFLDDSQLKTYTIDAKVESGVVTLSGELPSNDLKMRAEKLAGTVKGVRRVTNNITVRGE
jgi:type II secretory pathway pseudopilin PulG